MSYEEFFLEPLLVRKHGHELPKTEYAYGIWPNEPDFGPDKTLVAVLLCKTCGRGEVALAMANEELYNVIYRELEHGGIGRMQLFVLADKNLPVCRVTAEVRDGEEPATPTPEMAVKEEPKAPAEGVLRPAASTGPPG